MRKNMKQMKIRNKQEDGKFESRYICSLLDINGLNIPTKRHIAQPHKKWILCYLNRHTLNIRPHSFQCMTKFTTNKKNKIKNKKK